MKIKEKCTPSNENSRCKGPEAEMTLICWRNEKAVSVAGAAWAKVRL